MKLCSDEQRQRKHRVGGRRVGGDGVQRQSLLDNGMLSLKCGIGAVGDVPMKHQTDKQLFLQQRLRLLEDLRGVRDAVAGQAKVSHGQVKPLEQQSKGPISGSAVRQYQFPDAPAGVGVHSRCGIRQSRRALKASGNRLDTAQLSQ
ncbi:hypothetical protein EYF80_004512 [Liparis tanakae]|uniref:Uncharacterized protein n=1 Tax=Liparis tanakae TaxID=230148 RepID=A0A4Z2J6T3_9TELE|nr:hypothetical protein EYF80_004512 [Liparis tanakae]